MKCICCKFDNCRKEFEKHRSNTSFSSLDRQFETLARVIEARGQGVTEKVCDRHREQMGPWVESMLAFYHSMRTGVWLVKAR